MMKWRAGPLPAHNPRRDQTHSIATIAAYRMVNPVLAGPGPNRRHP